MAKQDVYDDQELELEEVLDDFDEFIEDDISSEDLKAKLAEIEKEEEISDELGFDFSAVQNSNESKEISYDDFLLFYYSDKCNTLADAKTFLNEYWSGYKPCAKICDFLSTDQMPGKDFTGNDLLKVLKSLPKAPVSLTEVKRDLMYSDEIKDISHGGDLSKVVWSGRRLTFDAERYLMWIYKETDDNLAATILVIHNIALVKKLISLLHGPEAYFEDSLVEGVTGLLAAIKKFDFRLTNRLSTYATWYIKLAVSRFSDTAAKVIKIPINKVTSIRKALKAADGCPDNMPEEYKAIYRLNQTLSLDYPIETSQSQEKTVYDIIPDTTPNPEEALSQSVLRDEVEKVLDTLPPREKQLLKSYYGTNFEVKKNLNELSSELGVTHQRTSQIRTSTCKKLYLSPATHNQVAAIIREWGLIDLDKRNHSPEAIISNVKNKVNSSSNLSDKEKDFITACYGLTGDSTSLEALAKQYKITMKKAEFILSNAFRKLPGETQKHLTEINPDLDSIVYNY